MVSPHYKNCPSISRDYRGHPERCECNLISNSAAKMARELIEITHAAPVNRLLYEGIEYVDRDELIAEFRRHIRQVIK